MPALLLLLLLGAREAVPQASAPFVSRLQAKAGQTSIVLVWRAVSGFAGSYRIYRHTEPIDETSFAAAVEAGIVQAATYEDFPPGRGPYYYAVLLDDGKLQRLFIPFRNVTSTPVQVVSVAPEQDLAARISGLAAEVAGDAVRLRFQASRADREFLLFRSLEPMRNAEDLLAASAPVTLAAGAKGYEDSPVPGLGYYYALVDAGLFKVGKPQLKPGENSTLRPAQVPVGAGRVGLAPVEEKRLAAPSAGPPAGTKAPPERPPAAATTPSPPAAAAAAPAAAPTSTAGAASPAPIRSAPLPYLDLDAASGRPAPPLPTPQPLGPAARAAVAKILEQAPPRTAPVLRAQPLPEDQGAGGESEGFALGALLDNYLLRGKLQEAEKGLLDFLAVRHSPAAVARARFYLGQVYHLRGEMERAVLELLMARELYYPAVEPWLDASLLALRSDAPEPGPGN